jgi:ElaB/YqjD/DUF883 family membrane-anchored ribosome-binding protein
VMAPAPETLRDQANEFARKAGDKARDAASQGKAKASDAMDGLSAMAEDIAKTLDEKLGAQYGDYARKAANAVTGVSDTLKSRQVDDLITDARDFVRQKPAVAIGAAVALGFALTRLLKAGTDDED